MGRRDANLDLAALALRGLGDVALREPRVQALQDSPPVRLYALEPVQKDRSFEEETALGPFILAWQDYLEYRQLAPGTLDGYERDMARVAKAYPTLRPEDFTPDLLIEASMLFKRQGRRTRMESVKSFFKWARMKRIIASNPFEELEPIRRSPRQKFIDVFSDAEVDDLLNLPLADAALMGILFETGLRKAEARNLQVRRLVLSEGGRLSDGSDSGTPDVRLHGTAVPAPISPSESTGELVVIAGKGGKDRTVQFGSRLHGLLQDLLYLEPMDPMDYLWYARPGGGPVRRDRPIQDGSFDRWWKRCLETAGVRYRNPHVARHTFAVRWLRRGGRLEVLSKQMGHSSIAVTADVYGGINAEDARREIALMEAR